MAKRTRMTFSTEELGEIATVSAGKMDDVLAQDAFGKFAILSVSDDAFIQAGNDWQPGAACKKFMEANDSDPWALEYREGNKQFRAKGHITLEQVRKAFRSYLAGTSDWRDKFTWRELKL